MAIYVDSADVNDARRARELKFVRAVTTNPSHLAKTGRPGLDVLRDLLDVFGGPVYYQLTADTVEGRRDQAWEAYRINPAYVVIKIPAMMENFPLAYELVQAGMTCGITAIASPAQAFLAAQAGVQWIAPYVNRMTRQLGDGLAIVRDMAAILRGTQTEILAASVKSVDEAVAALLAGAHHLTVPLDLLLAMGEHPFSQGAIAEFAADARALA